MSDVGRFEFDDPASLLAEEDEATLIAINRGIQADAGRTVSFEEVRRRLEQWTTKSSSLRTR